MAQDDNALLEAWRGGDRRSGALLFERYYNSIARFFANKASRDADDLIQRTFLRCVEKTADIRKPSSFRFYLFGIARNVLLEYYKEKSRRHRRVDDDFMITAIEDLGPTPSQVIANAREERLILRALRKIPLELQLILELYYWEELRARDLADVLEVPEGTVRTRIRRAKQLLEREIEGLAASPELAQSTMCDLDEWARRVREGFDSAQPT